MAFPEGVALATLTFSNPITHLGTAATRTEVTIEPTASVVWAATGQPIDDFPETIAPVSGMPGQITAPFTDQDGFKDAAGNDYKLWAYRVTRRAFFGNLVKTRAKTWQPLMGQATIDFDLIPEGTVEVAVTAPAVGVTSVNGQTGAVTIDAGSDYVLPAYLEEAAHTADLAAKLDTTAAATTYNSVLVHNGTDYPARPASAPGGYVTYIGPTQPTTWLPNDQWVNNA